MKLKTVPLRIGQAPARLVAPAQTLSDKRMAGRKLQARRLAVWTRDPHCATCGMLVEYPHGFALDHKQALHLGGPDTEENTQVLCIDCHDIKTREEARNRAA